MAFPASPANNETYTTASGITYVWITDRWRRTSATSPVAQVVRVDTTQAFSAAETLQGRQNLDIDPDLTVSGNVTSNGGYFVVDRVGDADSARLLLLNDDLEQGDITFRTGASGDRWKILATAAAESGSDVGSNFQIARYNDSAVFQDYPVTITRSTGATTFANSAFVNGPSLTLDNDASTTADAIFTISANTSRSAYVALTTNNSNRWNFYKDEVAESGSDAGSDLRLTSHDDSGTWIRNSLKITRSNGAWVANGSSFTFLGGSLVLDNDQENTDANIYIDANTSRSSIIYFRTGTSSRWRIYKDAVAESGSDVGSNFVIARYNDSGVFQDFPVIITRSTGLIAFANGINNVLPIKGVSPQINFYDESYATTANTYRWRTYSDSTNYSIQVGNNTSLSSSYTIFAAATGTRGPTKHAWLIQGATKANLVSSGLILTNNCTAVDFISTSDGTLKEDITVIDHALDKVNDINGYTFNWKDDGGASAGVIAQDIEKVLPGIVSENSEGKKLVTYNGVVGLLVEAVKDLSKKIDKLEGKS